MEDKKILDDKELKQVNGGVEANESCKRTRNVTGQMIVTCESNDEVIQGYRVIDGKIITNN